MLTYSRARGGFAGVDLSGSSITQDKDETRTVRRGGTFFWTQRQTPISIVNDKPLSVSLRIRGTGDDGLRENRASGL